MNTLGLIIIYYSHNFSIFSPERKLYTRYTQKNHHMVEARSKTGLRPIQPKAPAQEETKQESDYWTVSYGTACRMGWSCRSCKKGIMKGEKIAVRDGRKLRLTYHLNCFSGESDPRTQKGSSFTENRQTFTQQ